MPVIMFYVPLSDEGSNRELQTKYNYQSQSKDRTGKWYITCKLQWKVVEVRGERVFLTVFPTCSF